MVKDIHKKLQLTSYLMVTDYMFFPRTKTRMSLSPLLFNIVLENVAKEIRGKKREKRKSSSLARKK